MNLYPSKNDLPETSPFQLDGDAAYQLWRERKQALFPQAVDELIVDIANPCVLSVEEKDRINSALDRSNLAIYRFRSGDIKDKALVRQLGMQFGLKRLDANLCADDDGITSLQVVEARSEGEYIPYTNKRLNWHTDGYYNALDKQIRGIIMHCVRPAGEGGENAFLDVEMAYIQLRDANPDYVRALMAPDAMIIPPNVQKGVEIRPQQAGPVFSVDPDGHLHMRYSARTRNIIWKDDAMTQAAAKTLLSLFQGDSTYIFRHRLKSGEGIVSNNTLHCRLSFEDGSASDETRLLYRARYFDRACSGDSL